jgi:transcription-repair coupling factor (superfamily II helicase)
LIHPAVRDLFLDLARHPSFQEVLRRVSSGGSGSLSGLTTTAKALYSVLLWQLSGRSLVIVVDGNKQAEALAEAVHTFFDLLAADDRNGPQLLPALDVVPLQNLSPHAEILEQRAIGLWRLATQRVPITILPVASALLKIEPADFYRQLALRLREGDELPLDDVVAHLESIGYQRREPVEMVGEYSVRGGILDVFSPEAQRPVRIDLFGDQVESIRRFDVESQRSVLKIEECILLPLTEFQRSRQLWLRLGELVREADIPGRDLPPPGEAFPGWELVTPMLKPRDASVFSLLDRPVVIWDEPDNVRSAAERFWKRLEQIERSPAYDPSRIYFAVEQLQHQARSAPCLDLKELEIGWEREGSTHIATRPSMVFHGNMQVAIAEARNLVEGGNRVAFFASSTGEVERIADILNEYTIPYQLGLEQSESTPAYLAERAYMSGTVASIYLVKGNVRHGTTFKESKLVVFGSEDLFDSSELVGRAPASKSAMATFSADLIDLKPGDFVVHAEHGVAQYLGLREIVQGESKGDYMLLEYSAGAKLYVPLTRMDLVERFRGAGEAKPVLDRMGGATWTRTKGKV